MPPCRSECRGGALAPNDRDKTGHRAWRRRLDGPCAASPRSRRCPDQGGSRASSARPFLTPARCRTRPPMDRPNRGGVQSFTGTRRDGAVAPCAVIRSTASEAVFYPFPDVAPRPSGHSSGTPALRRPARGTDLWHSKVSDGPHLGDARITTVAAQPPDFGELRRSRVRSRR